MACAGKWVTFARSDAAAVDVAVRIISRRLETVWRFFELAATKPEEDVEYVHQLRVGTRRAVAAVEFFRSLMRNKKRRELASMLRQIRRAAGAARDMDVLRQRLVQDKAKADSKDLDEAIAYVTKRRKRAQRTLVNAYKKSKREGWKRCSRKTAKRKLWRNAKSKQRFGKMARIVLSDVVDDFFAAASCELSDLNALHRMRIRGKKLRYTMEIASGAFDGSLRTEVYPEFQQVQDRIGIVNDHASATTFFRSEIEQADGRSYGAYLCELMSLEQRRTDVTRKDFLQWWTPHKSTHLRRRFQGLLNGSDSPIDGRPVDRADDKTEAAPDEPWYVSPVTYCARGK